MASLADLLKYTQELASKYTSLDTPKNQTLGETLGDIGLGFAPVVGTAQSARDFERARRENDWLGMGLSAAGVLPIVGGVPAALNKGRKATKAAKEALEATEQFAQTPAAQNAMKRLLAADLPEGASTIPGSQRMAFPGIYNNPVTIAKEAETRVAPESENLSRLFGVTRADLSKIGNQPGTASGFIPGLAAKPKGSEAASLVMQDPNTRRLINILEAGQKYSPRLTEGMTGWYVTDPAYQRLVELVGPEEAAKRFTRFNTLTSMASPSSDVVTELRRGSAANQLAQENRFNEFMKYGGLPLEQRRAMGLPEDLLTFPSHAYHKTAQAPAMEKFLETGESQLKSPKVPLYMQASNATQLGRQTNIPVADAHFSRGVGLADTRNMRTIKGEPAIPGASISTPELAQIAPWFREQVAKPVGLEAVPGQANLWGLLSKHTGVDTAIGSPKLEILSDLIAKTAARERIPMELARDKVLLGEMQAGRIDPKLAATLGLTAAAGTGGYAAYQRNKAE